MSSASSSLGWDADVLARIGWLQLRARELVEGLQQGSHGSIRIAPNVEFADYKDYCPGDSLRDLDWRVMARVYGLTEARGPRAACPKNASTRPQVEHTHMIHTCVCIRIGRAGRSPGRPQANGSRSRALAW